jgi:hypothetical protein
VAKALVEFRRDLARVQPEETHVQFYFGTSNEIGG